jgi:hypothetical protein
MAVLQERSKPGRLKLPKRLFGIPFGIDWPLPPIAGRSRANLTQSGKVRFVDNFLNQTLGSKEFVWGFVGRHGRR